MPAVSVVMPVYNHASFVRGAVESVLQQTLSDLELIVVDDGSTDNLSAIRRYFSDERLLWLKRPHEGLPAALNAGFAAATGAMITWTSADNLMLSNCLERLRDELLAHSEWGAVYADYMQIDAWGAPIRRMSKGPYCLKQMMNFGPAFLIRTSVAHAAGPFDTSLMGVEDRDHSMRIASLAPVGWLKEVLYLYRVHGASLTGILQRDRRRWRRQWRRLQQKWHSILRH